MRIGTDSFGPSSVSAKFVVRLLYLSRRFFSVPRISENPCSWFRVHTTGLERCTNPQCAQIAGDALVTPGCIAAKILVNPQDIAGLFTAEFTRPQQALHIEMAGGALGR